MAKKTPQSEYTITLTLGIDVYKGKGPTALEALAALKKPEKIMNKGIVTITDGTKSKTVQMFPVRLKRLFMNKLFQEIQAKQLAAFMK